MFVSDRLKIVLLSGASSIHTIRWANGLHQAGHEIHIITQHLPCDTLEEGISVHQFPYRGVLGYFTMAPAVKKLLKRIKPDVVNAHYASGYATTARLVCYRPWLLSVWGSDVYDFPYNSKLHKWLVKTNLTAADAVASTSKCMAEQVRKISPSVGEISITPFGVDLNQYRKILPVPQAEDESLVIGTVKTLAAKYGIDTLIKSFDFLYKKLSADQDPIAERLHLRLVGDGPQADELRQLAEGLGIGGRVTFTGRVPHAMVPHELSRLDIYVALSRLDSESFGVAIIEAGAAGRPVIVSDAGGLPEVTLDGVTGLVVPRENPQAAASAMEKLLRDPTLRQEMGSAAQRHVRENYSWDACVATMLGVYRSVLQNHKRKNIN